MGNYKYLCNQFFSKNSFQSIIFVTLISSLIFVFLLDLAFGSVHIPIQQIIIILLGRESEKATWATIILKFRLPKALTATLAGAALGVSGLEMQTLFKNPLAGPFVCCTDIRDSQLKGTILKDANLWHSNLSNSCLQKADFTRANLSLANLKGADFKNTNLSNADLKYANLRDVINLTPEQVKAANNWDKAEYDPEFRKQLGLF